jgi:hypothetical protein
MCTSFLPGFWNTGRRKYVYIISYWIWNTGRGKYAKILSFIKRQLSAILLGIVKAKHIGKFDFFKFKIAL